ncbi:hypothetical protein EDD16DRAFT_1609886 [Pisolithus croceorrhizus]|nr:hypothetical protein EDD16DRAFT_1609886 [Pisolithus croceorrhizus]KAI6159854.1 hypothetical protein EDD17DRAFT_877701 [Pisolithus thermaeus]
MIAQVHKPKLINLSRKPLTSMVTMWTIYALSLWVLQRRINCQRSWVGRIDKGYYNSFNFLLVQHFKIISGWSFILSLLNPL